MTDLGEWDEDQVEPGASDEAGDDFVRDERTYFPSVVEWVEQWLIPMWRRQPQRWCPSWWRHPEAVARLDAMWQAWEQLRKMPGVGPSTFLRDHLDPHMAVLTSNDGLFARRPVRALHGRQRPPRRPARASARRADAGGVHQRAGSAGGAVRRPELVDALADGVQHAEVPRVPADVRPTTSTASGSRTRSSTSPTPRTPASWPGSPKTSATRPPPSSSTKTPRTTGTSTAPTASPASRPPPGLSNEGQTPPGGLLVRVPTAAGLGMGRCGGDHGGDDQ